MEEDDLGFENDKIYFAPPLFMWGLDPYDYERRKRWTRKGMVMAFTARKHHRRGG